MAISCDNHKLMIFYFGTNYFVISGCVWMRTTVRTEGWRDYEFGLYIFLGHKLVQKESLCVPHLCW